MPHGIFQKLSGVDGQMTIPSLGAHIGTMIEWELRRRGGEGSDQSLYDLRAVFSYVNPLLYADPDYDKEIVVHLGRRSQRLSFRVHQVEAEETVLRDRTLLMKGVKISEYEERREVG